MSHYNRYAACIPLQRSVSAIMLALSIVSCSSSRHSSAKRLPGTWQVQPIVIDGKNTDWPAPYPQYDDKAMLGYAISNDKDNLYITVETGDLATQLKILRGGLTVWIDKTGKQDEVTAINYPIPPDDPKDNSEHQPKDQWQQSTGNSQQKQRIDLEDKIRKRLEESREYSLQGFKGCNLQFPLLEKDTCGIVVRMDIDADNELVWEAVVPFKAFYYKGEVEKRDNGRPLSVCFETVGQKRPAGSGGNGNRGGGGGMRPSVGFGGMGMGGMRMGGGGMHGNHGNHAPGADNTMEPLYKSTKTWKTFGIAYP